MRYARTLFVRSNPFGGRSGAPSLPRQHSRRTRRWSLSPPLSGRLYVLTPFRAAGMNAFPASCRFRRYDPYVNRRGRLTMYIWARGGSVLWRFFAVHRTALPSCGVGDHFANGCFLTMRVLAGKPANGKGVRRCKLRGYTVCIPHVFRPTGAGAAASYTCPLVGMVLQWAPLAEWDGSVSLG